MQLHNVIARQTCRLCNSRTPVRLACTGKRWESSSIFRFEASTRRRSAPARNGGQGGGRDMPQPYKSRAGLSRRQRETLTPMSFVVLVKNLVSELESQRRLPEFRTSIGLTKNRTEKDDVVTDWFSKMERTIKPWLEGRPTVAQGSMLFRKLHKVYIENGPLAVTAELRFSLQDALVTHGLNEKENVRQTRLADLRHPEEWFPSARRMTREIHVHIGPTNSGKTYHALQRLLNAKSGVYAGPLRLLAHEVYSRVLAHGRSCHLVTGDERIESDDPDCMLSSSTVEMVPLETELDVAVIDEIQMLGDNDRGWAWTNAFLGLRAKELHVCGEERSLQVLQSLAALAGDKVIIHRYKRLSPLVVEEQSLEGDLSKVQPGDCLVAFSRGEIHDVAARLSRAIPGKIAVIYGSLPPDARAEQARLFNDPSSGYDVMVASNAIGMGLNLSIRRVIFMQTTKFDGQAMRLLDVSDVKQIGGRAGRYKVAPSVGQTESRLDIANPETPLNKEQSRSAGGVLAFRDEDMPWIRKNMEAEAPPIRSVYIKIPTDVIAKTAAFLPPETPLSWVLSRIHELARTNVMFKLGAERKDLMIADAIQVVGDLDIRDRLQICSAPSNPEDELQRGILVAFAQCIADMGDGHLFNFYRIPLGALDLPIKASHFNLSKLEALHNALTLYIWLSYRYDHIFVSGDLARHARDLTEEKINQTLASLAEAGKIREKHSRAATEEDKAEGEGSKTPTLDGRGGEGEDDGDEAGVRSRLEDALQELIGAEQTEGPRTSKQREQGTA